MKEPKIEVDVHGRRQRKTLHVECDPDTMAEIAALVFTKLQNTTAKPVPTEDVAEIICRLSQWDTAQQKSQDSLTIFGCLSGVVLAVAAFVLMVIGFVTVVESLWGD
jgi:hypothetical protein